MQQIVREEKNRNQSLQTQLGLMHPAQLRTALHISRRVKGGIQVSQGEIGFMQQHSDLFGKQIEQIGQQRATKGPMAGMIQELMQNTGQTARQQAAEKGLAKINQQFQVQINLNETALVDQIVRKVLPAVAQANQQAKQAATEALQRQQVQQQGQNRALNR
ncbi:MAG: hypothetical protein ACRELF_03175 [Gemmataceae bacterium]